MKSSFSYTVKNTVKIMFIFNWSQWCTSIKILAMKKWDNQKIFFWGGGSWCWVATFSKSGIYFYYEQGLSMAYSAFLLV